MNRLLASVAIVVVLAANVICKDSAAKAATERPKAFQRLIPADVLRDFPGVCFASTRCATVEPGETWELAPFCGRSTCVKSEADKEGNYQLLELVEDCGPLPKANPKCKLSEKTNKTAAFPNCCPIFECEQGVKLEYPEVPTPKPDAAAKPKA